MRICEENRFQGSVWCVLLFSVNSMDSPVVCNDSIWLGFPAWYICACMHGCFSRGADFIWCGVELMQSIIFCVVRYKVPSFEGNRPVLTGSLAKTPRRCNLLCVLLKIDVYTQKDIYTPMTVNCTSRILFPTKWHIFITSSIAIKSVNIKNIVW